MPLRDHSLGKFQAAILEAYLCGIQRNKTEDKQREISRVLLIKRIEESTN